MTVPAIGVAWVSRLRAGGPQAWVFALAAVGIVLLAFLWRDAVRSAEQQADATAASIAATLELDIAHNLTLQDLYIQSAISRLDPADRTRNRAMIENLPRDQYHAFIELLDSNGDTLAGSPPPEHNENWADTEYFRALRQQPGTTPFIGKPFAATTDSAGITLVRRIATPDGGFSGMMVVGLRLSYYRDLFARLGLAPGDTVSLLRNDGTLLMCQPFERNRIGNVLDTAEPFASYRATGATRVTASGPADSIERRFVLRPVQNFPLIVAVGLDSRHVYVAALRRMLMPVALYVVSVVLLAWAAGKLSHGRHADADL